MDNFNKLIRIHLQTRWRSGLKEHFVASAEELSLLKTATNTENLFYVETLSENAFRIWNRKAWIESGEKLAAERALSEKHRAQRLADDARLYKATELLFSLLSVKGFSRDRCEEIARLCKNGDERYAKYYKKLFPAE